MVGHSRSLKAIKVRRAPTAAANVTISFCPPLTWLVRGTCRLPRGASPHTSSRVQLTPPTHPPPSAGHRSCPWWCAASACSGRNMVKGGK